MVNYCIDCEFREECVLENDINFCEDCKHYEKCDIVGMTCIGSKEIECNNGFEIKEEVE